VSAKLGAGRAPRILFWDDPEKQEKRNMIKPASKNFIASAAALFTLALFVTTAPTARADDYCITNGAHAAHGCGYPSMEMCQAASSGIGGTCSLSASSKSSSDAMAHQPKQSRSRSELRPRKERNGQ
jgi:Protein of unknown function (DUF3551)